MKLCQCGCKRPAPIAKYTDLKHGWVKGQSKKFIVGHNSVVRHIPAVERFWKHVNKNGPLHPVLGTRCWEWVGATDGHGYGAFSPDNGDTVVKAHRFAWFIATGNWPTPCGLHKCDNPSCVRKSHLFEGSKTQNNADMRAKGRHPRRRIPTKHVLQIRRRYAKGNVSQRQLAREYNVPDVTVRNIITHHKNWKFR